MATFAETVDRLRHPSPGGGSIVGPIVASVRARLQPVAPDLANARNLGSVRAKFSDNLVTNVVAKNPYRSDVAPRDFPAVPIGQGALTPPALTARLRALPISRPGTPVESTTPWSVGHGHKFIPGETPGIPFTGGPGGIVSVGPNGGLNERR
jgi:hypothetical protein